MSDQASTPDKVDHGGRRLPRRPRWVMVTAIVIGALVLLFLLLQLTGVAGQHGPGRHMSSAPVPTGAAVGTGPASVLPWR